MAPKLSPLTLNESDFEAIGDALMEHGDVEVSRLTARVLEDHSSYYRGWHSELVRQRPTHREALREAEDMLVRTLTLSIGDRLSIHLRRHAGATYYRGNYELFAQVVLRRLADAAGVRRALLSDRARTPREPVTETISLRVPTEAMAAETGRQDLVRALGHLHGVQTAVYHVNPYLHFGVTDYLDGSTFDVFVTENDRVEVVPGFNASVGSLARVTEAMGDAVGMIAMNENEVPSLLSDEELLVSG